MPEIEASFLYLFDTLLEKFLGSFWGFVCRQPPPANPFSKPLILVMFLLITFSWLYHGHHLALKINDGDLFVICSWPSFWAKFARTRLEKSSDTFPISECLFWKTLRVHKPPPFYEDYQFC